jgi:hypothetical protein
MKMSFLALLLGAWPVWVGAQGTNPAPQPDPMAALAGMIKAFQGTSSPDNSDPGGTPDPLAAAAQLLQALQGGTNNPLAAIGARPAVDFRELRALLPAEAAGLRRTAARGKKTGAFGAGVSEATGDYGEAGTPQLVMQITDLAAMGHFGWISAEIDSEGDDGYERTTQYEGRRGVEKYRTIDRTGSAKVMVAGRFMVEIKGDNIDPAQLRAAAEAIDFDALERLANRPPVE